MIFRIIAAILVLSASIDQAKAQSLGGNPVSSISGLATAVLNFLENGAGNVPAQTGATQASAGKIGEFAQVQINAESVAATISDASPAVVTMTGNTFASRCIAQTGVLCVEPIYFTGLTGTSGVSNATPYFVDPASISGSTFKIATTVANALAGTDVNTTGTDSGTGIATAYIATSSAPQNIAALSLTPGDWACSFSPLFLGVASTAPTAMNTAVNQNSTGAVGFGAQRLTLTFTTGAVAQEFNTLPIQELLNAQTTIDGNFQVTWTGGATNPTVQGSMSCRRAQ